MNLGGLASELVSVLAAETGLPVGDGQAPTDGIPDVTDYPYLVVRQISDVTTMEIMASSPGVNRVVYQITAVGITRAQADAARDRARVLLDPTVAVATAEAKWSGARWVDMATLDPGDEGERWMALLRVGAVVVAV